MPPRPMPTHFLCIPLAGPQLARSLTSFRADVTSPASFAVPGDAVRPLGTLHLTLGVMNLRDQTLAQAVDVLRTLRPAELMARARAPTSSVAGSQSDARRSVWTSSVAGDSRVSVTLQGLRPMQNASQTSVLYAPPADLEGSLQRFCEQVQAPFLAAGLMVDERRPLLLHATIVNTIYAKGGGRGGPRGRGRERLTLDARDMLDRYGDYVWMENMPLERIAICRMGAKKIEGTDDAAYEVEAELEFREGHDRWLKQRLTP